MGFRGFRCTFPPESKVRSRGYTRWTGFRLAKDRISFFTLGFRRLSGIVLCRVYSIIEFIRKSLAYRHHGRFRTLGGRCNPLAMNGRRRVGPSRSLHGFRVCRTPPPPAQVLRTEPGVETWALGFKLGFRSSGYLFRV